MDQHIIPVNLDPPGSPTPAAPTPIAPVPPAAPAAPAPEPASFSEGGEVGVMKRIFGESGGEFGFTGIFIFGLVTVGFVYQIMYYRSRLKQAGDIIQIKQDIQNLKNKAIVSG